VHRVFVALRQQLGWRNRGNHHAPRIHDLRHNSECGIIPSTASNDAARSEVSGWEGRQRCSELSETLQEVHEVVAGLESSHRDLPGGCIGKRALLQLHVCMQVDGSGLR
jgi:hypothetical protein